MEEWRVVKWMASSDKVYYSGYTLMLCGFIEAQLFVEWLSYWHEADYCYGVKIALFPETPLILQNRCNKHLFLWILNLQHLRCIVASTYVLT